ncbi:hypothetical protein RB595_008649 [Gaeumannomyces hyphopodioides]
MAKLWILLGLAVLQSGVYALAEQASCGRQTVTLPLRGCNITLTDQTVFSWGISVSVNGTPLCASPSTVVSNCLWEHEDVCSTDQRAQTGMTVRQCRSRRGNFLTTADILAASAADRISLADKNPNWVSLMYKDTPFGMATKSPLQLQGDIEIPMLSGIIDRGLNHTNSHFALDDNSAVLRGLKGSGHTHALSFAIDSGSTSYLAPRTGSVTLGGYIPTRFAGRPVQYNMSSYDKMLLGRRCPIKTNIVEMVVTAGNQSISLVSRGDPLASCIEPHDRAFRFSTIYLRSLRNFIKEATNWTEAPKDDNGKYGGLLDLEPGLIYSVANTDTKSIPITMEITLNGSEIKYTVPAEEMVGPLRGLDDSGAPAVNDQFREIAVYRDPAVERAAVLGRAFLSQAYLFVDYEKNVYKLGPLNRDDAGGTAISSGTCQPSGADGLWGAGSTTIAVSVLSSVVFLLLIATIALGLHSWKHRQGAAARETSQRSPPRSRPSSSHEQQQFTTPAPPPGPAT